MKVENSVVLNGEYLEAFNKATRFIQYYPNYSGKDFDNGCLVELFDILYTAQQEEKSISEVTGPDFNKFVDNVYSAYYPFSLPGNIYKNHIMSMFIAFVVVLVFLLIKNENSFIYSYFNLYIVFLIANVFTDVIKSIFIFVAVRSKNFFDKITKKNGNMLISFIWFVGILTLTSFNEIYFFDMSTSTFLIILGFSCIPGLVYFTVNSKHLNTNNSSRKNSKIFVYEMLEKKYDKTNFKRLEKGLNPFSKVEWSMKLKKRYKAYDIMVSIITFAYIVLIAFITLDQMKEGFTLLGIIMIGVLVIILLFLTTYYFSRKSVSEYIYNINKNSN